MTRYIPILATVAVLAAGPALAADFDHAAHLAMLGDKADCVTCHLADANAIRPDEKVCLACHDQAFVDQVSWPGLKTHGTGWALQHRPAAKGQAIDCAACHEQDFCLECHKSGRADEMGTLGNSLNNVHRAEFRITHPIAARTDPQLCSSCHERKFCSECHDEFRVGRANSPSHRRVFPDYEGDGFHELVEITDLGSCDGCHPNDSVSPDMHSWSRGHAREARRSLVTCQACHPDGDVCLKCHSETRGAARINPHGNMGDDLDRLKRASNGKTCRRCHPGEH
jgi:hypothetical protein